MKKSGFGLTTVAGKGNWMEKHQRIIILFTLVFSLIVMLIFGTACGSKGPTNEQAAQAIQEYLKTVKVFSDYKGPYDVKITAIGKSVTLGDPPNEWPAWPVKAYITRQLLPAVPGVEKLFLVMQDSFGAWKAPAFWQTIVSGQ